ncbi:magnesium transporter CorA family protein [Weissella kandleri]|uniref:magnesium transporter CorA family protein n=1 Tax=Weissella kandleri TaxID=1616 RepID=UPI00387EE451
MIDVKEFDDFKWVQAHQVSPDDRKILHRQYDIANEMINYAIDPYESARVEVDDNYLLMIFDIVTPTSAIATTEPVGIMIEKTGAHFITFTRVETRYIETYINKISSQLSTNEQHVQLSDLLIDLLRVVSSRFQSVILEINRRRAPIQRALRETKQVQTKIDELMSLQTDLIYLLNSLHSDEELLVSLQGQKLIPLTASQMERLEDVRVELQQAIDTGELSQQVTNQVEDSYAAIANNNLNWTMKLLTALTIILTIPTMVSGFYGENVKSLPWANFDSSWLITVGTMLLLMLITTIIFWVSGFFKR